MKKMIFHSVPFLISLFWLVTEHQTYSPISLKGPDFLKFYLLLLSGFYTSVIILKLLNESISKTTFFFLIFIIALGIIKLIKGIILHKPIGYLVIIVFFEAISILYFMLFYFNKKLK